MSTVQIKALLSFAFGTFTALSASLVPVNKLAAVLCAAAALGCTYAEKVVSSNATDAKIDAATKDVP